MTNLIRVRNLTTNKTRLYEIANPDVTINKGDLVRVQFGDSSTALGIAASYSAVMSDDVVSQVREALGLDPNASFKRVVSLYTEVHLESDDDAEEDPENTEEDAEMDPEDDEEAEG